MPIHRLGVTALKQTAVDGSVETLKKLLDIGEGHVATYVHVRNDPIQNSSSTAYVLYVGTEQSPSYPLLYGEAKDFFYCDPSRFAINGKNHAVFADLEVTGCDPGCPGR